MGRMPMPRAVRRDGQDPGCRPVAPRVYIGVSGRPPRTPPDLAPVHRIFPFLLLLAAAFVAATMALGFLVGPSQKVADQWYKLHFLVAVTTAIVLMLVNAIVLTYFIGTSRWCREVTDAYSLPPDC